jgi:ribosomal protein L4
MSSPNVHTGTTIDDLYEKVNRAVISAAEKDILAERMRCARLVVDSMREASRDFSRLYGTVVSHEVLKLGAEIYQKLVTAPLLPEEPPSHGKNS